VTLRGALTRWGPQREGAQGTCQRMRLGGTHLWRPQRKGCFGTREECDLAKGAHELGPAGGGHDRAGTHKLWAEQNITVMVDTPSVNMPIIRPYLDGLIQGVTGLSTVLSNLSFKARRDGDRTRITAACIPVYMGTVLSPN